MFLMNHLSGLQGMKMKFETSQNQKDDNDSLYLSFTFLLMISKMHYSDYRRTCKIVVVTVKFWQLNDKIVLSSDATNLFPVNTHKVMISKT